MDAAPFVRDTNTQTGYTDSASLSNGDNIHRITVLYARFAWRVYPASIWTTSALPGIHRRGSERADE